MVPISATLSTTPLVMDGRFTKHWVRRSMPATATVIMAPERLNRFATDNTLSFIGG